MLVDGSDDAGPARNTLITDFSEFEKTIELRCGRQEKAFWEVVREQ
jgi:hypothetical protein